MNTRLNDSSSSLAVHSLKIGAMDWDRKKRLEGGELNCDDGEGDGATQHLNKRL